MRLCNFFINGIAPGIVFNSLLKILEEPPPETIFLLTTAFIKNILPTIVSRCQSIKFPVIPENEIFEAIKKKKDISSEKAKMIAEYSLGSYKRALELIDEEFDEKRKQLKSIIKRIFSNQKVEILNLSEELAGEKDRGAIKELLKNMVIELKTLIKNVTISEETEKDKDKYKFIKNIDIIPDMITEIEKSIDLIDKNVYLNFLLKVLFFRLNSKFYL